MLCAPDNRVKLTLGPLSAHHQAGKVTRRGLARQSRDDDPPVPDQA